MFFAGAGFDPDCVYFVEAVADEYGLFWGDGVALFGECCGEVAEAVPAGVGG